MILLFQGEFELCPWHYPYLSLILLLVYIRAKAFLKRIAICSTETGAAVTAGLLFMTSEILANRPELKSMLTAAELAEVEANLKAGHRDSDDEDDGDDNHSIANESTMTVAEHHMIGCYDAAKRNPLFACSTGLSPSLYELALLKHHYHPSTQAFAAALLQAPEHGISFSGDPLLEFNTMAFLNRFAYKNPKQNIAQNLKDKSKNQEEPVNLVFTQGDVDESKIAPEKHFFYKFFGERESLRAMGKSKDKKKKRQDDEFDSDDEDASVDIEGREEGEELNEEEEIDRFADKLAEDMMKHDAATRGDDYGDFSEDEEDDDEEFTSEPEDADDDNEEDDNKDQSLKKRKKASESTAFDFEEFLAEQGRQRAKKQKTVVQDDEEDEDIDDEDEEDEEEPEMYMDSDDEVSDDGEEGEFPAFLDDDDVDEDELMEEEVPQKDSKSKKGKKKAKRDDDNDDDDNAFADAADYEDQMDEIVNAYKYESTAAKISKAMFKKDAAKEPVVEEKSSKKGSVKFAADVKPPAADKKQKNKKSRR